MYKIDTPLLKPFLKQYNSLHPNIRKKLDDKLCTLVNNPFDISLDTHKNHKWSHKLNKKAYQTDIDNKYRFVWYFDEEDSMVLILVATGKHDIIE